MATAASFEDNLAAAGRHLARYAAAPTQHLIDGVAVSSVSGETFPNESPIDGMPLGDVAAGASADIAAAAAAARASFEEWSGTPGEQRKRILHSVADAIVARAGEIAGGGVGRHRAGHPVHVLGRAAGRGELPVLR